MFSVVYFSYRYADEEALRANEFDFEPIREVAYLFAGLFATMIPALQLIANRSSSIR
ncbi:MAG: sodium:proton antiporter [Melioribacteraceae bacterium]|nr:sodium:proton antiporter [Melioribacteraceae bacterium]